MPDGSCARRGNSRGRKRQGLLLGERGEVTDVGSKVPTVTMALERSRDSEMARGGRRKVSGIGLVCVDYGQRHLLTGRGEEVM